MSWYNPFSWGEEDNSMEDVQKYMGQMEPMLHEQYDPFRNAGLEALPQLQDEYSMLLTDPAAKQAMLGSGYTQSPGYQYQYDTAMNAGNQQLAAGGMLGTPSAQTQMMGTATGLANQDYWNYYNQNADLYQKGLQGTQGLYDTGFDATNQLAAGLGSMYGNQAKLAYANNQSTNNMFSSLLGAGIGAAGSYFGNKSLEDEDEDWMQTGGKAVGTAAGTAVGGPAGGVVGGMAGNYIGGLF